MSTLEKATNLVVQVLFEQAEPDDYDNFEEMPQHWKDYYTNKAREICAELFFAGLLSEDK